MEIELDNSILPWLGKTMKMLGNYVEDEFNEAGIPITRIQFVTLKIISKNGDLPQNNLAFLCGRDKTTFTRNLNILERKQLVQRCVSTEDKRIKLISITPKGTQMLKQAQPIINKIMSSIEKDISETDREQFKDILSRIRTQIPSKYSIQ